MPIGIGAVSGRLAVGAVPGGNRLQPGAALRRRLRNAKAMRIAVRLAPADILEFALAHAGEGGIGAAGGPGVRNPREHFAERAGGGRGGGHRERRHRSDPERSIGSNRTTPIWERPIDQSNECFYIEPFQNAIDLMLDTDQLRSFLAIVDEGSFTRAAERVHKTQSAVSMHIRRLEEQLGCALFVKQGRSARLTEEGQRLIDYARRMIQVEAGAMAALSRNGLQGSVRFGIPDDYAEAFLAGILTAFNRRHPLVEVA